MEQRIINSPKYFIDSILSMYDQTKNEVKQMYNFGKKKNKKVLAAVVIVLIAAMVLTTILAAFM